MRKYHQKAILDLLRTLEEATGNIKKLTDKNDGAGVTNLLADCQDAARQIGELIESFEGEGTTAVTQLEEYCELLYQANTELSSNGNINAIIKKIGKQLIKIENSVKFDFKLKLEVVFFPYKASMWDSLESIYLAAKDDPDCDAYVVPIPYYDKLPNGSLGEMHFEGNEYPKNIPVADYKTYNVEERRPDVIFVHNPYDGGNFVTSVHPDYYCERLRNFTEMLCYVPYFVINGDILEEHFAVAGGCVHAHKIIVQSEKIREQYIAHFKKHYGNKCGKPEDKFIALGSPKIDKAVNAKREDYEIPENWQKIVGAGSACSTGTSKKTVFYNTSIGALLEHTIEDGKPSNKYLQKIKNVFEFFKNQSDLVLLWRPHPLLESTIKSMRPWLAQEYANIVREYKNGGYGIYDDSEDLNRAIAVSDAYYGDGSSVAPLFEAAGKPVAWQLFEPPQINGFFVDANTVWFIGCLNALYRHDKKSKETEYMGLAGQHYSTSTRFAENNGKLYFTPCYKNDKISVYDMEKKTFEQIEFKDDGKIDVKFYYAISYKNFVYFIPHSFPAIMRLNTDTKEIVYFSDWTSEIFKLKEKDMPMFSLSFCIIGTEIILPIFKTNSIMSFDMETGGYEIKCIGAKTEQYIMACFDGENCCFSLFDKDYIVKWNRQTEEYTKIKLPSFSRKENQLANFLILYHSDYIWLFPAMVNKAFKIDVNTNEITELPELTEHFENKNLVWQYGIFICAHENFIYVVTKKGIAEYNINSRELNFIKQDLNEYVALPDLISDCKNKTVAEYENVGKKIWEAIKQWK